MPRRGVSRQYFKNFAAWQIFRAKYFKSVAAWKIFPAKYFKSFAAPFLANILKVLPRGKYFPPLTIILKVDEI
jgi:hypothetical protein